MPKVDLILHSAAQLVTCVAVDGPKRRQALLDPGLIPNGAVAVAEGLIVAAGPTDEILADYQAARRLDTAGKTIIPGLVDCHTHAVYSGERIDEFELRLKGADYLSILQAGGGILSTVRATRQATVEELAEQSWPRLLSMLGSGTTTAEIKSGYGLSTDAELKMLRAMELLHKERRLRIVPTFLGAHTVPEEFRRQPDDYVRLIIEEMLPAVAEWYERSIFALEGIPFFCDIFCEENAFDAGQAREILSAGLRFGLRPKIHADEFNSIGGLPLAVQVKALSADHLDAATEEDMRLLADSKVIGVILPLVNFNFGSARFADARKMIDEGMSVALATDINPGSAPCPSLPLAMAVSCRYQHLLPAEALNAATINAAYAIGLGKHLGSIEPGKRADLLVLDVPDYRYLAYQFGDNFVSEIYLDGRQVLP